jgi:hypothetical protein
MARNLVSRSYPSYVPFTYYCSGKSLVHDLIKMISNNNTSAMLNKGNNLIFKYN